MQGFCLIMIELRPYQARAVDWLQSHDRGWVVAPAASGKTIIAAGAIHQSLHREHCPLVKPNVGWLANTREQVDQAWSAVHAFGLDDLTDLKIECAAAQCDWSDRDILVVDEFHHSAAPTWRAQIETCAGVRWGFTATPGQDRDRLFVLQQLFGERYDLDRSEVVHMLTPAQVIWLDASDAESGSKIEASVASQLRQMERWWRGERWQLEAWCKWRAAIDWGIVGNLARTQAAVSTARTEVAIGRRVLILVNEVEHGKEIARQVEGATACFAAMGVKRRRAALDAFRSGACRCLVATSLADEGLDLPMIESLILVSGGRSRTKVEQRTGRALRLFAGKERAVIFDFADTFHPFMAGQARDRRKLYRELGYHGC